jgi:hypothetical protein
MYKGEKQMRRRERMVSAFRRVSSLLGGSVIKTLAKTNTDNPIAFPGLPVREQDFLMIRSRYLACL